MKMDTAKVKDTAQQRLIRSTSLVGAIFLGLGSIIGTGAFVSLGFGYNLAGDNLLYAVVLAGLIALCNGLSSAQLAAVHPVAGGTYEYGYQFLTPSFGFTAGWFFILAKSASGAAAALASAWLINQYLELPPWAVGGIAATLIALLTTLVLAGLRRSNQVNVVLVGLSIASLLAFVVWACSSPIMTSAEVSQKGSTVGDLFAASALVFVAFTGYGRIATLGEEVREPRRIIPLSIVLTIAIVIIIYVFVAYGIMLRSPLVIGENFVLTQLMPPSLIRDFVFVGAIFAMLGVALNLVLGVSRVLLAMARRGDLPPSIGLLNTAKTAAPRATVITAGVMILIVMLGGIRVAWTFSAFTVLVYYSITNLAALRISSEQRFMSKGWSIVGLLGCMSLALMIDLWVMSIGLTLLVGGLVFHRIRGRLQQLQ